MRIRGKAFPLAGASVMVVSLLVTCAPTQQATRPERSPMTLRLPPMEAIDLSIRSERREQRPEPPYSVADEYRGRWLTLFELTASHLWTENLPETGTENEGR